MTVAACNLTSMPRGFPLLARAFAGLSMLVLVAQCSNSSALAPETTIGQAAAIETSAVETTAPARTTSSTIAETTTATVEPTTTTVPETTTTTVPPLVIDPNCPATPHAAVIDRDRQRAWLCDNGVALPEFVITTAREQPDPGMYPVFAKSMHASSRFGGHYSTMTHFVAFTYGKFRGARIAFHSMPTWSNGEWLQPLESVGDVDRRGESAGCLRVLPDDAVRVWDWLAKGDEVRIIN